MVGTARATRHSRGAGDEARDGEAEGWRVTLYEWVPGGGAYDGLPADFEEAARRRAERFVVTRVPLAGRAFRPAPPDAPTPHALGVRRC